VIAAVGIVVVLALVAVFALSTRSKSPARPLTSSSTPTTQVPRGPVTLATALTARRGKVVFSDDFDDPGSGWITKPTAEASYAYTSGGFTVTGTGNFYHQTYAPYTEVVAQVGVSVTALQDLNAPLGAGFGVVCRRGSGAAEVKYSFLLENDQRWQIVRHDGPNPTTTATLKEGTAPVSPGLSPNTVVGMCATQPDNQTTQLTMFVNGTQVADITDTAPAFQDAGWITGIATASQAPVTSTVTAIEFQERNLER